jgi:hypothetical protein
MKNKLERIWEDTIVAQLKALSRYLPGETEEKPRKTSVRINGLRAEI